MQRISSDCLPPDKDDEPHLLALNNEHAVELSLLDAAALRHLLRTAYCARITPDRSAFLMAFDAGADYQSPNFLWFRQHYPRFVYIDRVVVASSARGRGLARLLYADLFRQALADGHEVICCEVNLDPPNPASDAFHAALGFQEVGRATLENGKIVRYLAYTLSP